jgi:hypothetical protein
MGFRRHSVLGDGGTQASVTETRSNAAKTEILLADSADRAVGRRRFGVRRVHAKSRRKGALACWWVLFTIW